MEELKEEKIKNKTINNINLSSTNKSNDAPEKNNKNNNEKNDNNKTNKTISEKENDIQDEIELIKLSHIKKYTNYEIIKKSLIFSSKNIKLPLYNIIKKFLNQYLDIKIPIIYSKLLNAIIKEKNYDSLCNVFKTHSALLFLKVIFSELSE